LKKGWLIVFEGIDGAGKSTQVERLAGFLRGQGRVVQTTREPTTGQYGAKIRQLSGEGAPLSLEEELALFVEDRREHVRDLIEPALARGEVVLSDRYYLSNVAYQGARGLEPGAILARNEALFPAPTAAILLEASAQEGLGRVLARGGELNRAYEQEDFLVRVAEIYAELDLPYLIRVPATGSPEQVHAGILRALEPWLSQD
jgi:dTMP kinase